ncbi:tRNA modification GTPase MnmE [Anatilimnocola aggregata]|uniref:tRNA modification GTPase MnmE n=1 Tax=Anatilimnocola aggregata TaxID=2528021 RepID=A0A517YBL4_9BACT|nr:GTPase [Anatilimnocola aggregata]QDU27512.1 tRNA modification GTPase MnmE [Anatilimnocola aggregata]
MSLEMDDTIVAIASATGGSYEGIIRLSGPATEKLLQQTLRSAPTNRKKASATIQCLLLVRGSDGVERSLPAIVYLWRTSRSYTRQPLAEIYLPGSPPLLDLAISALCAAGARLARPGEFTLRAFLAGRLDLTQAEAVLGVIEARDAAELQTALAQLAGGLSHRLAEVRNQLLDLLAHLEAGLDFVDEDIEFITRADLQTQVAAAATAVRAVAEQLQSRAETSSTAPRVVLLGEPNAGKSSLLNALANEQAAIVSPMAGTTRDYLARLLVVSGKQFQLIDTAGIETASNADQIGSDAQDHRQQQQAQADLEVVCIDSTQPVSLAVTKQLARSTQQRIVVLTKCDLDDGRHPNRFSLPSPALRTSATTGAGLNELRTAIVAALDLAPSESLAVPATAIRCSASLQAAAASLAAASDLANSGASEEWIAAELRLSLDELGQVVGAIYTDDILDRVFSRFCIGK